MASPVAKPAAYSAARRLELSLRNQEFARAHRLEHVLSYGSQPVVVYPPCGDVHGNFCNAPYRAIVADPDWKRRLAKAHTSRRTALPKSDRPWCELDSSTSSDALLMNVFCHPHVFDDGRVASLLGVAAGAHPEFGFNPRVPLAGGKFDRTEVDMRFGTLLVEAKLTEGDFQRKSRAVLNSYRDFAKVFDRHALPQTPAAYDGYQLIRNVLAAHATGSDFCVLHDARRPDLREQWFAVMRCVKRGDLRRRCKVLTWQELAEVLPKELQLFLEEKYGINQNAALIGGVCGYDDGSMRPA